VFPPAGASYGPNEVIPDEVVPIELAGGCTGTIGLTPALLSSVAPSGIVPPLFVVSPGDPGVESGEASPGDPAEAPAAPQPPLSEEPDVIGVPAESPADPPPSKVEFVVADPIPTIPLALVPVPLVPGTAVPNVLPKQFPVLLNGVTGAGLRPPPLISVDPIGIPTGPAEDEPSVCKGDALSAGPPGFTGAIVICATAVPQPSPSTTIAITARISDSVRKVAVRSY
jgi:hypothetical protein